MQPELSGRSQLFDSLKSYLNNKSRLQPIIGLGSIIECVNVGSSNRETLYLCEVCVCRVTKADIRNHILGSLHRFNYIKARHPHLASKWQKSPDLSKLAWPLMELAKTLEGKEGPGDVKLFEVADAVYKMMATESETHAVTLYNAFRDERGESGSFSETPSLHYPVSSQRTVLLAHNQQVDPEITDGADTNPYVMSAQTERKYTPSNTSTSQQEDTQMSSEFCVLSKDDKSSVEEDSRAKTLIGLVRVVEIRSDNGSSHCFLCHCCRIKSNKRDFIDHLTSSSHLFNYLTETRPDLIEGISDDTEANFYFLQSLANSVEQQEGPGQLKIVNVPESFCRQLTGKSYHWCLRMLSGGWVDTDNQEIKEAVRGVIPKKSSVVTLKNTKRQTSRRKKKKRKKTNTMFNVSLPLGKGAMLMERMSFNKDNLLESTSSPSPALDPVLSPTDCELQSDSTSFELNQAEHPSEFQTSLLDQDVYQGEVDCEDYIPEERLKITVFQDTGDGVRFKQSAQDSRETGDPTMCRERQHRDQERFRKNIYKNWENEDREAERGGLFSAVSHNKNWPPYNSYYRQQEDNSDQWFSSALTRPEIENRNMSLCVDQRHPHQQHQNQQMFMGDEGRHAGDMWGRRDLSDEVDAFIEAAKTNGRIHTGCLPVHSGSMSPVPNIQFLENEPRRFQTYTEFDMNHYQTAPQSYMTQSAPYQLSQMDHGRMFDTNSYGPGHSRDPEQYHVSAAGAQGLMQPNAYFQPEQAVLYGAFSGPYFRAGLPN